MLSHSLKFYSKFLTLLLPILEMVGDGLTAAQMARTLISYYLRRAKQFGYVKENLRNTFKSLELTQLGKNFLAQYTNSLNTTICRLENVRFKATVYKMPRITIDWNKAQLNNWSQYGSKVDNIIIHLNNAKRPTIEFIPAAINGDDPYKLFATVLYDCTKAAEKIEKILDMEIGRLEVSSRAEWLIYDPVAKQSCKHLGQVTVDGIGKINASKPRNIGEFEFFDPRVLADYMLMPRRVFNLEQDVNRIKEDVREILRLVKQERPNLEEK